MQKKTFILLVGLFAWFLAGARTSGKIDLKIVDQEQKPLDGIFVQLVHAKDSSMAQYAVSNADGSVEFTNVPQGDYRIYILQTGFNAYFSNSFPVDDAHSTVDLSAVALMPKSLNAVTIVDKTPAIQHFADKTVVNVQNSPLNAVGSVFDVIDRSPGIMVDQNDNISMQGKQGISVMIDGRITPISGSDLANLLRSMPAESVERIEFITNPSAKYDANGSAGIINIILKKDRHIGANATVYAGYSQGIYPKTNDGFSFNDRTKKFNIFGSYNYAYRGGVNIINFATNFYNGSQFSSSTQQNEYLKTPSIDNIGRLGADFFASDKTTVGIILDGSINKFLPSETTTTYEYDSAHNETSYNTTSSNSPSTTYNYAINLNMKHKFDSVGRELLINADYATFNTQGYQNIGTSYYNTDNSLALGPVYLYGYLPRLLNIYSFKMDYDGQLGKKGSLEAGIKSSYVTTDNNVHIYDGQDNTAPVDTTQSNHFIYNENINAAYMTYARSMGRYGLQAGLRAEQTITNGDQVTTDQTFSRNFLQLFPNLSVSDSLSSSNQLGVSVSRRIDRPTYEQLNPFSLYINPTFYLNGNPYLLPQNSYIAQLSDAIKSQYFFSFTYTYTQYPIITVIEPYPGKPNIVEQTDVNLSNSNYFALNFTISSQLTNWWNTTTNVGGYLSQYSADVSNSIINTNRYLADFNTTNTITLSKKISMELHGFYASGYDLGYLFIKEQWGMGGGFQMKVLKDRGTIKLNANDIFWTNSTNGTTYFTGFTETVSVKRDTRTVGVSFTYHFGGQSQSSLRSKGGAEDEKKRAGGNAG
jgi:hypothetical protein